MLRNMKYLALFLFQKITVCYFELFSAISCSSYVFGLFSGPLSRSNITETNLNSRKCICIKISVCPAFDTLPIQAFGGIWHNFLKLKLDSFERYNISGVISETLYIISTSHWQIHTYTKNTHRKQIHIVCSITC